MRRAICLLALLCACAWADSTTPSSSTTSTATATATASASWSSTASNTASQTGTSSITPTPPATCPPPTPLPSTTPSLTCPLFTDSHGRVYNINGMANGGEGFNVLLDTSSFFKIALCEPFGQHYGGVNPCSPETGVCFINRGTPFALGNAYTRVFESTDEVWDGFIMRFTGGVQLSDCFTPTSARILFLCDPTVSSPIFNYTSRTTSCEYRFTVTSRQACRQNQCPTLTTPLGTINITALNIGGEGYWAVNRNGMSNTTVQLQLCGAIPPGKSNCTALGLAVCANYPPPRPIGYTPWEVVARATQLTVKPIDLTDDPHGVVLRAIGGEQAPDCLLPNSAEITIKCDPNVLGKPTIYFEGENKQTCTFVFTTAHSIGCMESAHYIPGIVVFGTFISGGSILLICFAILLVIYCSFGIMIQKCCLHKSGCRAMPNYALWSSLPGLTWDGVKFTLSCGKWKPSPARAGGYTSSRKKAIQELQEAEEGEGSESGGKESGKEHGKEHGKDGGKSKSRR